jgi:hypothetical protein
MLPTFSRRRIGGCGIEARAVWADIVRTSTGKVFAFGFALGFPLGFHDNLM